MSRQFDEAMEERAEAEQLAALASVLGLEADYLAQFDYEIEAHESDDGVLYGYNVTFPADAPKSWKIGLTETMALVGCASVRSSWFPDCCQNGRGTP